MKKTLLSKALTTFLSVAACCIASQGVADVSTPPTVPTCKTPQTSSTDPNQAQQLSITASIQTYLCQIYNYLGYGAPRTAPAGNDGNLNGNTNRVLNGPQIAQATTQATNLLVQSILYPAQTQAALQKALPDLKNLPQANTQNSTTAVSIRSISSLLNQTGLKNSDANTARAFILYLSGQTDPVSPIPQNLEKSAPEEVEAFNGLVAVYAAAQSTGLNVLNYLLQERIIPSTGNSGFADALSNQLYNQTTGLNPATPMSPLQLDEYMATRRVANGQWYQATQNATPGQLSRENLNLLAEIRYEMYEQRLQMEQMNATMAVLQLTLTQAMLRPLLDKARKTAISTAQANSEAAVTTPGQ